MKRLYFGTDGVRGIYGGAVMNEDFAWRLGAAAAAWLRGKGVTGGRVLIGRDTRASGVSLSQALADGLVAGGCDPVSLGILPTPAVSRAVRTRGAALGVVVTASHNPATDNGIKFFGPGGIKLTDDEEGAIEALLPARRADAASQALKTMDGVSDYLYAMEGILRGRLAGWTVVLDTAHGATVHTSSRVLRDHGAQVVAIGADPDGLNINEGVGSEHPEKMCAAVSQHGARLGIAHDGDGDRCVLCDERGEVLDGDEILTILALHALKQG
jgi:phosphoglucosamine mutase